MPECLKCGRQYTYTNLMYMEFNQHYPIVFENWKQLS